MILQKRKFHLCGHQDQTFSKIKEKLMMQPLLVLPDLKMPFEVHFDACGDDKGAVLSQEGDPFAYKSHHFHDQEKSLGVYEKELISMIHALES